MCHTDILTLDYFLGPKTATELLLNWLALTRSGLLPSKIAEFGCNICIKRSYCSSDKIKGKGTSKKYISSALDEKILETILKKRAMHVNNQASCWQGYAMSALHSLLMPVCWIVE